MMKRASALALICVAAVVVGLPPIFGTITESQFQRRIDEINGYGVWSLETIEFERRWFGSTVTVNVGLGSGGIERLESVTGVNDLTNAALALLDEQLTVLVDVAHGPLTLRGGPRIGLASVTARPDSAQPGVAALEERLGIPYLFEFRGNSGLFGGLRFDADVPPVDYGDGTSEFVFSGLRSEGRLFRDELASRYAIDSVTWSNPLLVISADGISFNGDNRFLTPYQWLGSGELAIEQVLVVNPTLGGKPVFAADNITIGGEADLHGEGSLITAVASYSVDSFSTGERFSFTDGQVVAEIDRLDAEAANDYFEALAQIEPSDAPSVASSGSSSALLPALHRLLTPEPTLSVDPISVLMDGEPFDASVYVRTHADALPDGRAVDSADLPFLPDAISAVAEAAASRTLVHRIAATIIESQLVAGGPAGVLAPDELEAMAEAQVETTLGMLVAQGLLEDDGESYRITLEFENGTLSLNGTPLPVPF